MNEGNGVSAKGNLIIVHHYYRSHLKHHADRLFVFGDNMVERGFGGQAKEARGEPNAVGIPTKWGPSMREGAFFTDRDLPKVRARIDAAFDRLEAHIANGGNVVWPQGGVGTGLADLPRRAPAIMAHIRQRAERLRAQGIEAGTATTAGRGAQHESPVACDAPKPTQEDHHGR